eukprot:6192473-Pleurochrysis_carterae.AAC.2
MQNVAEASPADAKQQKTKQARRAHQSKCTLRQRPHVPAQSAGAQLAELRANIELGRTSKSKRRQNRIALQKLRQRDDVVLPELVACRQISRKSRASKPACKMNMHSGHFRWFTQVSKIYTCPEHRSNA